MKIGVELRLGLDAGELYADARAYEAAGADSLWFGAGPDDDLVLAAVAAATSRVRLIVARSSPNAPILERLSRGRFVEATGDGAGYRVADPEAAAERWMRVDFPADRAAWKELRARHDANGTIGLILANDPRLLDLIRNPDVIEDRQDIKLAFG